MAFSTYQPLAVHIANGVQTDFAASDKFYDLSDVRCVLVIGGREYPQVRGVDYSVLVTGQDLLPPYRYEGFLRFVVPPANGAAVVPFIQPQANQDQPFEGRPVTPRQHERVHDRAVMSLAILQAFLDRGYRSPLNAAPGLRTIVTGREGYVPTWDEFGNLVEGPTVGQIGQIVDIIPQINAVAAIVPQVVAVAAIDTEVVGLYAVRAQIAALGPVAGQIATLAPQAANIATLAPQAANIGIVGSNIASVVTVAGAIANVNVVATNITSVDTAAANIAAIIAAPGAAAAAANSETAANSSAIAAAASAASIDVKAIDVRRNLIVNGSMAVSQENGNVLGTTNGYYPADQWALYFTAASAAMSVQRVQARTLANALDQIEFKTTTAKASLAAGDSVTLTQNIEGSAFVDAGFGTANAKPLVLRAQVQLPAGLYHFHFQNSAGNRHCAVPFTVTAGEANTAVVKTIVVPADTSGTWLTADGVIGGTVDLVLAVGTTKTGGSASTWGGTAYLAASTQFNILSSTSNVARLADVGLKLDPDNTGVYGAYRVNEVDAVYRSERFYLRLINDSESTQNIFLAYTNSAGALSAGYTKFGIDMAKRPSVAFGVVSLTNISSINAYSGRQGFVLQVTAAASGTAQAAVAAGAAIASFNARLS